MNREKIPMGKLHSPIGLLKNYHVHIIKDTITPQAFYACELERIFTKKAGWADGGLCPFHPDKQIGSFRINLSSGAFKCFACNAGGGDIITFIMQVHGLSFREALLKLAQDWGVSLC